MSSMINSVLSTISNKIIQLDTSIISALKKMDEEDTKLLFVFDKEVFNGILTIGDIQRAIIKNKSLNEFIHSILSKNKIYASPNDDIDIIKDKMYQLRSECMPVVNESGSLVEVYFWADLFDQKQSITRKKIDIPVIVMAGGFGTRLKPLTNVVPKPLIPIDKKTILEIILDQFMEIGCVKYYLSVNYKSEIIEYYLDHLEKKYDVTYFKEEKPLGTIGSVSLLKGKINTPFFVSNCDIIIDQDYRDVYDYHINNKNDITIVTAIKSFSIPYGVIETGENGLMCNISEKPDMNYMINTGVYLLQPELIDEIPDDTFYHITNLMEKVRSRNGRIGCFPVSEKSWTDIGDWNEYLKLVRK